MNVNLFVLSLFIFLHYVSCKKRCTKPKGNVGDVRYDECIESRCMKVKGKAKWVKSPAWEHCCVYNGKLFEPNNSIIARLNVSSECAVTLICKEGGLTEVLLSSEACRRHYDMSEDEWYPIIDCREELNLAITPGDSVNSAVHTKEFDPTNDRQLWRQDKEGRIYNKHNGQVWEWDQYGSRFAKPGTAFFWSFNDCFKSSWNPPRVYLQSLSDKGKRCINMANVNDKDGTNLMLFPCDSMNPPNGCFKFKL